MATGGAPTFEEIKTVLSVPQGKLPKRTALGQAAEEMLAARTAFLERVTPETWGRLVAAAQRLHTEVGQQPQRKTP